MTRVLNTAAKVVYTKEEIKMLNIIDYGFKQLIKTDKRFVEINVDKKEQEVIKRINQVV